MPETTFFRLLVHDDKAAVLEEAVAAVGEGRAASAPVYLVSPNSFGAVPFSPFAYWVSARLRAVFGHFPPFEAGLRASRCGLGTTDNFRFLRLRWEVDLACPRWVTYFDGGSYSPFYEANPVVALKRIEVNRLSGSGRLRVTGNIDRAMRESITTAVDRASFSASAKP